MARLGRIEVFSPNEVAVVHVFNRVVRRCFLMGVDPVSRKNFNHRKRWVEERLEHLASCFGIDLLCFSILSNHFHLVLRSRPDVVASWDDDEVAQRWVKLCPPRTRRDSTLEVSAESELNMIRNNPLRLKQIRSRLSDISWWMRLLCQNIAMRANREDGEVGKFWQSRYRAVRLLDEEAILACAAYVDLNPIRAALATTLEASDFTSVQRRIQAICNPKSIDSNEKRKSTSHDQRSRQGATIDRSLAQLTIDELRDSLGSNENHGGYRCSNKGFLSMSIKDYIELLDWTARSIVPGKLGSTPMNAPPILGRLSMSKEVWFELVRNFGRLFSNVAGKPKTIDATHTRIRHRRFNLRRRTRELFQTEA